MTLVFVLLRFRNVQNLAQLVVPGKKNAIDKTRVKQRKYTVKNKSKKKNSFLSQKKKKCKKFKNTGRKWVVVAFCS